MTIRPNFASTMCFWQALVIRNAPLRCTFMTASQSASVILKSRLSRRMPALLTSTVGRAELVGDPRDGGLDLRRVGDVDADRDGLDRRAA